MKIFIFKFTHVFLGGDDGDAVPGAQHSNGTGHDASSPPHGRLFRQREPDFLHDDVKQQTSLLKTLFCKTIFLRFSDVLFATISETGPILTKLARF